MWARGRASSPVQVGRGKQAGLLRRRRHMAGGKPAREPCGPREAFVFHLVGPECLGKGLAGKGHGWAV